MSEAHSLSDFKSKDLGEKKTHFSPPPESEINAEKGKENFDFLKSKVRELYIPLPNFKYFHKPSSEEDVFENFIGQEENSEQLENWLTNGDSGSYLVTGYRGMGKSSFVGNVLNKITENTKKSPFKNNVIDRFPLLKITRKNFVFNLCCSLFILSGILWVFKYSLSQTFYNPFSLTGKNIDWFLTICLWIFIGFFLVGAFIFIRDKFRKPRLKRKHIEKSNYKNHKSWFEKVFGIKDNKEDKHNLVIKLNLGHESLNEKDILSLVAKRIYDTYKGYLNNFYTNCFRLITKNILLFGGAIFIVCFLGHIDITKIITNINEKNYFEYEKIGNLLHILQNITNLLISSEAILFTKLTLLVISYFVVKRLYNFVVSKIPFLPKNENHWGNPLPHRTL